MRAAPRLKSEFARLYDRAIFDTEIRALYASSDLYNMGEWDDRFQDELPDASQRLVGRHLAVDSPEMAADVRVVLDAGCGLGGAARMMAVHYPSAQIIGVNISLTQAMHAAKLSRSASFVVMNAAELSIASKSVDRIHAVEAAFGFHTRRDFFREARRVLRPGGKLIITDILYRRALPLFPAENVCVDGKEYIDSTLSAGFVVEQFTDLTNRTAIPFLRYMEERGQLRTTRILRRTITGYCFVVLSNPC
jgi:MPBQ/MSBQ methyltransferase